MSKINSIEKGLLLLTNEVYNVYETLKKTEEVFYKNDNLSETERSVLFTFINKSEMSIPEIARKKSLTRQRIQQVVNGLQKRKLLERKNNPIHLSSPLFFLTDKGKKLGLQFSIREQKFFRKIKNRFQEKEIVSSLETLKKLKKEINSIKL